MGNYDFGLDLSSVNTMSVIAGWIREHTKVLEFGSANGRLTKYLKEEKNCCVTIVEIDAESGEDASEYAAKSFVGSEMGDIEKYNWIEPECEYDYIIFADVLEHLSNPKSVLEKCRQCLKESGEILVSIPNISHNSVIIDLCRDEFNYDETGLLDKTHIHFFTYKTFLRMTESLGFEVKDQSFIYSRVGNNEIDNSYFDIPTDIANYLRKRPEGSIYQYVFALRVNQESKNETSERDIPVLSEELREPFESKLYYLSQESVYTEENRISVFYSHKKLIKLIFDVSKCEISENIRWDPMEYNLFLKLISNEVVYTDGSRKKMKISSHNADETCNNYYLFQTSDPQIYFQIENEKEIENIEIEFELISYRFEMNDESVQQYIRILNDLKCESSVYQECAEMKQLILEQTKLIQVLSNTLIKEEVVSADEE